MYGSVAILLPASITAWTSGGASSGAIAWPLGKSIALPCGWYSGSLGLVPPVPVSAVAIAGMAHATKHANAAMQQRICAGSPNILSRPPAELADGLALKELARFPLRKFAPTTWFPRSGQARIRRGVTVANAPESVCLSRPPSDVRLELHLKRPCLASGGSPGARGAGPRPN